MKTKRKKQVEPLKVLKPDNQQSSIKNFISKNKPNPEIVNELEKIWKSEEKINGNIMFYKGYKKYMILQTIKQYKPLEIISKMVT